VLSSTVVAQFRWLPMSHFSTSLGMPGDPSLWTVARISSPVRTTYPRGRRQPPNSRGRPFTTATETHLALQQHRPAPSGCIATRPAHHHRIGYMTESLQFASSASQARVGGPLRCLTPEESITVHAVEHHLFNVKQASRMYG
jgi:hypothetical protein